MTHEENEGLKLGQMVIGMIRDVLSTPAKDEALASRSITTRGNGKVYLLICKEEQTVKDLEAVVSKRMDMVQIHLNPGEATN